MVVKILNILFYCVLICLTLSCSRRASNSSYQHASGFVQSPNNNLTTPRQPRANHSSPQTVGGKLSASEVFEKYNSAVFMIYTSDGYSSSQGSGFFINSDGLAASNYHVFKGTGIGLENIKLSDGNMYKLKKVVAKSEEDDYIVFYVDIPFKCNFIPIYNRQLRIGERVFAIGSPRGLENTLSSGEISQLRGDNVIQINVPIDHGSSGGALIDEYGKVVGITTAGMDDSGANLNFAIDIAVIKPYL